MTHICHNVPPKSVHCQIGRMPEGKEAPLFFKVIHQRHITSYWYCCWLKSGVHQLRLLVYPIISMLFTGWISNPRWCRISSINRITRYHMISHDLARTNSDQIHAKQKHLHHLESRWVATPIGLGLSWPLTNRHLLKVGPSTFTMV